MPSPRPAKSPTISKADETRRTFATLSADHVLSVLETSREGLSEKEASRRLQLFGANKLPHAEKRLWYHELAKNFIHFFAVMLWVGAGLAWVAGFAGWRFGDPFVSSGSVYVTATTVTFAGIVMAQIGNAFAWRSDKQSIFRLGFFSNGLLLWCIGVEIALMLILIYVPPFSQIFAMSPPATEHWMVIAAFGVILLLIEEMRKVFVRNSGTAIAR